MRKQISFMSFLVFLGLLVIGIPTVIAAQGAVPALVSIDNDKPEPLFLAGLAVDVRILGVVAETRMTMTFSNPYDRQLAGDLYFPLPEGATVSGYALDINGVMIDGVVVEKDKGRQVFESLTRVRIDPGLVEWVKGNNFKTRVFPIPAHGSRTIMVRYLSELFPRGRAMFYQLPLRFSQKIKEFSLRVEVANGDEEPKVRSGEIGAFAFKKWRQNFVAETKLSDSSLPQDLVIEIPDATKPRVVVEKNPEGEYYFLVSAFPESSVAAARNAAVVPGQVTIFWDASGSRGKGDHQREFEFLKTYFAGFPGARIALELILFRSECEKPQKFWIENGNVEKLLSILAKVEYDGGTTTGCLAPAASGSKPDQYLLFSDGIANFGEEEPAAFDAPLYVFSGDSQANHPFLHHLAEKNNGRYFNLAQVRTTDAAQAVGRPLLRFSGSEADESHIRDTYPRSARAAGPRFVLVGRLLAEEGSIVLNFGREGGAGKKIPYRIYRANAVEGELLQTFWAQKKIEELMIFSRRNNKELIETGKAYGLVTPGTSLIVLDNLEQYVEHRIMPPKSLPDMRRQYLVRIEQIDSGRKRLEEDRFEKILSLWSNRSDWWKTDFSKLPEPKQKPPAAVQTIPVNSAPPARQAPPARRRTVPTASSAQLDPRSNAGILGKIVLEDGSPIPGVTISLKDPHGAQTAVVSDEEGKFWYRHVPAGVYELKAELEGFRTVHYENLRLPAGKTIAVTIPMELGAIREEVTIAARVAPVDVRSTAVAANVEDEYEADGVDGGVEGGVEGGVVAGVMGGVEGASQAEPAVPGKGGSEPAIAILAWDPQAPYIQALKAAADGEQYAVYMEQRKQYGASPGFYLDCTDFFFAHKKAGLGLRVLSNIAELELENGALLRVLGHRLQQLEYLESSAWVFAEVLRLRPEEPQSYRDLALVLATQKKYERAIELLNHIVMGQWDRFNEIELIALEEMNNIIEKARAAGVTEFKVSPRLITPMDLDIRVVMTWDADMTDIDLWVTEPTEEKAFYSHNRTSIGGLVSRDFTDGYGPEEYLIRKAKHGVYKIQANYYGSRSSSMLGPVTVQIDVFTNWGRANEKKKSLTLRLSESKEVATIGEIEF
ncbi:MAG: VIT domain-containing protein [Candidatus Aminicenantes bacterium]|nr:VIT domain-containing protein [Candidatus Aminicenantes bacterium]